MTTESPHSIRALFLAASKLPSHEIRHVFLKIVCGADQDLLSRVSRLLEASDERDISENPLNMALKGLGHTRLEFEQSSSKVKEALEEVDTTTRQTSSTVAEWTETYVRPIASAAMFLQKDEARREFLAKACGNHRELRSGVDELLSGLEGDRLAPENSPAKHSITHPKDDSPRDPLDSPTRRDKVAQSDEMIGPYRIIERIAEGGMGIVYVAEQAYPVVRKVALKVIKPGMDSKQVTNRFNAERQALAMMEHPNIAKVFDAGVTAQDGPYFVMEFVDGKPLTQFCDEHCLGVRQRLELFVKICRAVLHAHTKGMVHRDLKPSNILVEMHDGQATPKIIDFGIAKALERRPVDATTFTSFTQFVGTPLYMSPEQARLSPNEVDIQSDVYSLGSLLYELLTGMTPLEKNELTRVNFDEMRRIIREVDPPKPSQRIAKLSHSAASQISACRRSNRRGLWATLNGDLDWICLKALEKDRTRRYASSGELADDIARYLEGRPILARPPSIVYRIRKYAGRHKALLTTATLVTLTALVGAAFTLWYALEARATARNLVGLLYSARMKLASDAISVKDPTRASELLSQYAESLEEDDPRGFEWHYFEKLARPKLDGTFDLGGWVNVAISSDGDYLAASAADGTIQICDARSWKRLFKVNVHSEVNGITWSNEGTLLAASDSDGVVRIWNVDRHTETYREQTVIEAHSGEANDVVFSRDDSIIFTCGDDHLAKSWSVHTGDLVHEFRGHKREVEGVALSRDGLVLGTASSDRSYALWNARNGNREYSLEHNSGRVTCIAFQPRGRFVAAGTVLGHVFLVDMTSGEEARFPRQADGVEALTFLDDGRSLATANRGGVIQVHNLPDSVATLSSSEPDPVLIWQAHAGRAISLATNKQGASLITGGSNGKLCKWQPDPAATRWETYLDQLRSDFTTGPDDRLYCAGRNISVWDLVERRHVASFAPTPAPWKCIDISRDGRRLAAACRGRIALFDTKTHELIREWLLDKGLDARRVAVSPDGQQVAFADYTDREYVEVYQLDSDEPLHRFAAQQCECLTFSPDGSTLAAGHLDNLLLFSLQSGEQSAVLEGHASTLSDAAFGPEGETIATVSSDRLLKFWDVASGQEQGSVVAHNGAIESVDFSPDGRTVATAGLDQEVKLWHTSTRQPVGTLQAGDPGVRRIRFCQPGTRLVALRRDSGIVVFDADKTAEKPKDPTARFQEIPDLPGGLAKCMSIDMSRDGKVVVGHGYRDGGYSAFIWSESQGTRLLEVDGQEFYTQADGVSDDGKAFCGTVGRGSEAHFWANAASSKTICPKYSSSRGISSDGQVVIGSHWDKQWTAFKWEAGELVYLPASRKHRQAEATAVTSTGSITLGCVYNTKSGDRSMNGIHQSDLILDAQPVLWTGDQLKQLAGFSSEFNWWPSGISDDGSIIVGVRWPIGQHIFAPMRATSGVAFRWEAGQVQLLELPDGCLHSEAFSISGNGKVIVGAGYFPTGERTGCTAFAWDEQHKTRLVDEMLGNIGMVASGWFLDNSRRVSFDGTMIQGQGTDSQGNVRAWIAELPPGTFAHQK